MLQKELDELDIVIGPDHKGDQVLRRNDQQLHIALIQLLQLEGEEFCYILHTP
jgi:hypothetical protein